MAAHRGARVTVANTAASLTSILTTAGYAGGKQNIRVLILRAEVGNTGRITIGKTANITAAGTHADSTGFLLATESLAIDQPTAYADTDSIFVVSANGTEVLYIMLFE